MQKVLIAGLICLVFVICHTSCNKATCPTPVSTEITTPVTYVNRAVKLDGVDDYLNLFLSSSIYKLEEGTVSLWVKMNDLSKQYMLFDIAQTGQSGFNADEWVMTFRGDSPTLKQFQVVGVKGKTGYTTLDAYTPPNSVVDTNWHNIIVMSDPNLSTIQMYVDGVLQPMTIGACCRGNLAPMFLGDATDADNAKIGVIEREAFFSFSKFTMDDFGIWNRTLTNAEIQSIVNDPLSRPSDGLVVNYTFDQFEDLGVGLSGMNDIRDQIGTNHADAVDGALLITHE